MCIAQTWIWFPGDYENWLGNQMNNRRTERGFNLPVQWKMDNHEALMIFTKDIELTEPEEIEIYAEGKYTVSIGRQRINGNTNGSTKVTIPKGKQQIKIKVLNYATVPAIFLKGKTIQSDQTWMTSPVENESLIVNMKHPDSPSGYAMSAGTGSLNDPLVKPSEFKLNTSPMQYVSVKDTLGGRLYDFGKETFGYIQFHNLSGSGKITIQYGETFEEALSAAQCETFYTFDIPLGYGDFKAKQSNALRYVFISTKEAQDVRYDNLSLLYEYNPVEYRASFVCNDAQINKIWEVGRYTLHLTTRECFIDGIKRDRWAWSGDAYQSYLMNYYMFFDSPTVKRTIYTLRGNDPVMAHLNNILDYSFYWLISVYDYYMYTGDKLFLQQVYPKMESMMDFILERRNKEGMVEGLKGDWVYIDWFDHKVDLTGEVSFEQILYCRSLEAMAASAEILGVQKEANTYSSLANEVKGKLGNFWDKSQQAFIFNRKEGQNSSQVTKHANMFAVNFDYVTNEQKEQIKTSVLMNKNIPAISTPYMRFYELEALCKLGEQKYVMGEMKKYWGGMIDLGATTFWEKYNPENTGIEHYAMYGRPFGKSLCHAWGASPIYLLGKYYVGVKPLQPGYKEFEVKPELGGLEWFESSVPTPKGDIKVYMDKSKISVTATEGEGTLIFKSKTLPKADIGIVEKTGENDYTLHIKGDGQKISIKYKLIE
jgi:alpha-L-rhamnosidase